MPGSPTPTLAGTPGHALAATLRAYRFGNSDRTTRLLRAGDGGELWRATHTPLGPGTVRVRWDAAGARQVDSWGPGGEWLTASVQGLLGEHDEAFDFTAGHPAIAAAQHRHPHLRLGRSGTLYHELLPVVVAQRVTAGEAIRSWHRLVDVLGEPAPGPLDGLRLPPAPDVLARRPAWWFHPLGIEARRAETLRTVAAHAAHLWRWSELPPAACAAQLSQLRGVGRWTTGSVLGPALGDPDAVAVGDFHLKHAVAWALAGEPRGTDERMLELLAPYAGQRGRAVRLLLAAGAHAPRRGPRRRVLPMYRW